MNTSQKEYIQRINRVIDYIYAHPEEELSLTKLANVALFSPFHFHRIFSAFVGETLNDFVKRIRLEKAARLLLLEAEDSITEIAEHCGYSNPSAFSRAFKRHFNISAQNYRSLHLEQSSKNSTVVSKISQAKDAHKDYICNVNNKTPNSMKSKMEIKEMPALNLVCCKHIGPFEQIGQAYKKLIQWAAPRGLMSQANVKTCTVYHDDPKVTDINKLRQSACITIEGDVKTEGEISTLTIPSGMHAVGRFEVSPLEFKEAWDYMCKALAESGQQPADAAPYELYHNNHEEHPEKKFIVDICIPVKAL